MTADQLTYLVFGIVLLVALVIDLGLLSKKSAEITLQKAFIQTLFWVALAFGFFGFLWWKEGSVIALEYLSAYLMEWSLSIDNIFVFILIFSFFKIRSDHVARALLVGILMAIVFRVIFITIGVVLVEKFAWILYIFGAFLVYTGIKIFTVKGNNDFDPAANPVYRLLNRVLPIEHEDESGKFSVVRKGKRYFTNMFVVIVLLATTDIVFALDSIPAVFAISQDRLVIYTSNVFAVLGLRSLFFLLRGAVAKFEYLQQGIAIV
ncbi:MAG TPA: TerC/Alx family metal homeostasis membrane protein, partial [Flavisolibacter sp.]|nr:TerC/Alx family metal homeostasis membrane protein [Flavisolibacter sp.]